MQDLAGDIVYTILGHLQGSRQVLKTCSLVCKTWEPVSRSILFRSVKVNDWWKPFSHFDDFLSASPHVAAYILHLELVGQSSARQTKSHLRIESCSTIDVPFMQGLLSKLPMLQSLRLHLVKLSGAAQSQTRLPALQRFDYGDVPTRSLQSRTFPALGNLIALFPSIDHLILRGNCAQAECDDDEWEQLLKLSGPVEIRAIELYHLSPQVLAAMLHAFGEDAVLDRLDTLAMAVSSLETVSVLGSFLRRVRGSIQYLRLDCSEFSNRPEEGKVSYRVDFDAKFADASNFMQPAMSGIRLLFLNAQG